MWPNPSVLIRLKRDFALLALCASLGVPGIQAQAPLVNDQAVVPDASEALVMEWKVDAAERAMRSGLPVLAADLYQEFLEMPGLTPERLAEFRVRLAAALIAQRHYEAARSVMDEVQLVHRDDVYYLYLAITVYGNGRDVDAGGLGEALSRVSVDRVDPLDRPWFYLLQGMRAELAGEEQKVVPAFEKAESVAISPAQEAFFAGLVLREKITHAPASEELAAEVRGEYERLKGQAVAYPYAREYAIILHNMGRGDEAVSVIDAELGRKQAGYSIREQEQLLLLKGIIMGSDSVGGRNALRKLVSEGKNRDFMGVALQILSAGAGGSTVENAELFEFLSTMINRAEAHPMLGQMYYLRSQLALARAEKALEQGEIALARTEAARAEEDARVLLERFPGLNQITNVYRLLAYAALQKSPAQYRAAADYLIQLRDQTEDPALRRELNRLIGDCYFLNGDYTNATDFYQAARNRGVGPVDDGELFLRLITAEVRSGQIDSALQQIDEADFSGSISVADRWRAEWNVAQALQAKGELPAALERVRLLLEDSVTGSVPAALDLRLRWLEARLSLLAGELKGVHERVDTMLTRVESIPEGGMDVAEARLLITEMLLLKADILIRSGDANNGMAVLKRLRNGYAQSSAAERSYLTEANYHASIADFEAAQKTLSALASTYPDSLLAPQALFEAALYCERRGPEYFAEAVRIHNDLAERYASDPLVFFARLKQGDLLRQMNDFAGAQIVYENLINRFPEHPRRYVAELSRADCLLALAKNNAAQLNDAALVLERLIDIPNLPIDFQAEAGYKWGFALMQQGEAEAAKEVLTLISSRFLLEGEQAVRLGVPGRYWMSRVLLDLGSILEGEGQAAEARRIYRKIVAYNLPGRNLAQSLAVADGLQVVE